MSENQITSTGTENRSYEEKERADLCRRITDFHARFGYSPFVMFLGDGDQAALALKRPEPEAPGYMNSEQAAAYIGVHPATLRKWVRLGVFPRIPLPGAGKDFRFSKAQIDRWAEERAVK